jgi:hypothetical protein
MLRPKYHIGQPLWYTNDNGTRQRVRVSEIWWGGKYGSRDFWVPKFHEGQKVLLRGYSEHIVTVDSVRNYKSSWECDRSNLEHGGYVVRYKEPRYYCSGDGVVGEFDQSEMESTDDSHNTERDIRYAVQFEDDSYKIVRQTELSEYTT